MSHFSVLVITDSPDDVKAALAPYHEFECTGEDDQYVQTIDKTAEAVKEYAKDTSRRLRDPDGGLHEPWLDRFYREPTEEEKTKVGIGGSGFGGGISFTSKDWGDGRGYRAKVAFIPEGWTEVELPTSEVETFAVWARGWYGVAPVDEGLSLDLNKAHKYGYMVVRRPRPLTDSLRQTSAESNDDYEARMEAVLSNPGVEVVAIFVRTNPNKKWDWYEVGGRWTGALKAKPGAYVGRVGRPGLMTDPAKAGTFDQLQKRDVDFEEMRDEKAREAGEDWDLVKSVAGELTWESWEAVRERVGGDKDAPYDAKKMEEARAFYNGQEAIKKLNADKAVRDFSWDGLDRFLVPRDEYVQAARDNAIATFAVLKDGQWYERGKMGWWACVTDKKEDGEWGREFTKLIDELDGEKWLTVVDCHI